ncbi:hypothetical protein ACCS67_35370, partial [Rhizobium brockwellii]|uniref:hypothetical protein n=1 Tax=Rhizobium brockwellii TaxID=3019932 RepID=UPI003F959C1C
TGGRSDWDSANGEPAPQMSWSNIQEQHKKGICFGSHHASHTPASAMENEAFQAEAKLSRNALQRRQGTAVESISLPY